MNAPSNCFGGKGIDDFGKSAETAHVTFTQSYGDVVRKCPQLKACQWTEAQ